MLTLVHTDTPGSRRACGGAEGIARQDLGGWQEKFLQEGCACSRGICQLLPKPPSCVYFGAEEEGRREGSIFILLVAMERGQGKVCGAQEPPDLHAQLPEKPSPVSPVGLVLITRQTFNYFSFMLLLNQLRELQKIVHFYFCILY